MPKLDRECLENFVTLLEKADTRGTAGVPEEPLTLHRRGHWLKSSIAHPAEVAKWQTRYVQGVVSVRAWEFKSPLRHQIYRDM